MTTLHYRPNQYIPPQPAKPCSIAQVRKRLGRTMEPLKTRTLPLKRNALVYPPEQDLHPKRLRMVKDPSDNNTSMYAIFTPGPTRAVPNQQCGNNQPFNLFHSTKKCAGAKRSLLSSNDTNEYYSPTQATTNSTASQRKTGKSREPLCCIGTLNRPFTPPYVANVGNKENDVQYGRRTSLNSINRKKISPRNKLRRRPIKTPPKTEKLCDGYNNFLHMMECMKGNGTKNTSDRTSSVKYRDDLQGYSSGFNPMLTSTPQHSSTRRSKVFFDTASTKQMSDQCGQSADNDCKNKDSTVEIAQMLFQVTRDTELPDLSNNTVSNILNDIQKTREEVIPTGGKVGPDRILFSTKQSTTTTEIGVCDGTKSSEYSGDDNNNKKDSKLVIKRAKRKLPGMYPIGAPQAASSPIHPSRSNKNGGYFDSEKFKFSNGYAQCLQKRVRHPAGNMTSLQPLAFKDLTNCVWRPW